METIIQRVQLPDNRRILMVSDPHGHATGLRTLLDRAKFSKDDVLVIVGDLLDKGPENLKILRMVMTLCRTHTVYPLMGNVDYWRLRGVVSDDLAEQQDLLAFSLQARKWWGSSFLEEMCDEIGVPLTEDMDTQTVYPRLRAHFAAELDFLASLPTILETQKMIFVHGGIPHEALDALAGQECHPLLKWDHFMSAGLSFRKYVVVGHWPATLYSESYPCANPLIDRERRIISLDGGCGIKDEGQLNLLSIPCWQSEDFQLTTWDDLPTITALDAQEASVDSGYIHWGDDRVTVLQRSGDWAQVLHHSRQMRVPAKLLSGRDGDCTCREITDYRLPVSPGDKLALIDVMPEGCYAKKAGVTGWYTGRYVHEK